MQPAIPPQDFPEPQPASFGSDWVFEEASLFINVHSALLSQLLDQKPTVIPSTGDKPVATDKLETLNKFTFLSHLSSKANYPYAIEHIGQMDEVFVKERNFR